jgi:HPt (histidine-containing phosphotransfer) domain-containing protein
MTIGLYVSEDLLAPVRDALAAAFPRAAIHARAPGAPNPDPREDRVDVAVVDQPCMDTLAKDGDAAFAGAVLTLIVRNLADIDALPSRIAGFLETGDATDGPSTSAGAIPDGNARNAQGFDFDRFAAAYRDSPEILQEIVSIYLDEAPERIAAISDGLESGDLDPVIQAAHSLVNTSGTLGNDRAVQVARALEAAGRNGDHVQARTVAAELEELIQGMLDELTRRREQSFSQS